MSYLQGRMESLICAFKGVAALVRSQPNARIHLAATVAVVVLGFFCGLDRLEWCLLVIAILGVWVAEGMNTAIETLADAVCPDPNPMIGRAKDVAAASVLIAAAGAVVIGFLIFGGRVERFFR